LQEEEVSALPLDLGPLDLGPLDLGPLDLGPLGLGTGALATGQLGERPRLLPDGVTRVLAWGRAGTGIFRTG
jgi:hypothetical protein